jgi:predicted RNase H-like HicB family nuclease
MRHYVALVHKAADSDFGVSFPDFPGCVTAGSTLEEAASMAAEALSGHIDLMIDEDLAIPEPTDLDTIMTDPENRSGVPVLVPAMIRKAPKTVRVNITLPEHVLAQIDQYAESHGYNRSGFLAQAAKKVMEDA